MMVYEFSGLVNSVFRFRLSGQLNIGNSMMCSDKEAIVHIIYPRFTLVRSTLDIYANNATNSR